MKLTKLFILAKIYAKMKHSFFLIMKYATTGGHIYNNRSFKKKKKTAALLNSSDKYKRKKTDNDQMKILVHQVIM